MKKLALFVASAFLVGLAGCGKETPGEKLDKGLKDAGKEVEKAGEKMQGK